MWDNRCKIAVSGVGFSKVTRSADIPLAAHALEAVKGAVADSGLRMADIFPEHIREWIVWMQREGRSPRRIFPATTRRF